ncbi:hypothetical protein FSP39_012943 [Pinctada imbricata]|uniref:Uncharacterized protein n=1 Tax=Pinctada imbricata TaxID=66713 RepID=A0AA89C3V8_PINIB|nr:hypothetical protein FSP39_012943 [Pinctada imbricata]
MTGGSFTTSDDAESIVTSQPQNFCRETDPKVKQSISKAVFDDAHCERDWTSGLCQCHRDERRNCCTSCMCWPYYKYMVATRLGETPFMALIPCAVFALRIKIRSTFGIKGSLVGDFWSTLCCEPCAVCQMTRELDKIGI